MKALYMVTWILVVVGALNWGLIGLFNFNLVEAILGNTPVIERLVYILVGLSAMVAIATHFKNCKMCVKEDAPTTMG